LKINFPAILCK